MTECFPLTRRMACAHLGKEPDARRDALVEVGEMKFFVRPVDAIIGQPETHQHDGYSQYFVDQVNDRDGAAIAKKDCWRAESLMIGPRGGDNRWMGAVNQRWIGAHQCPNTRAHARGCDPCDIVTKQLVDFTRVLIRHQTKVQLGDGACRNRGLDAGPLIAADDATYCKGGPDCRALVKTIAGFAPWLCRSA